jgi:hypothetical protein
MGNPVSVTGFSLKRLGSNDRTWITDRGGIADNLIKYVSGGWKAAIATASPSHIETG